MRLRLERVDANVTFLTDMAREDRRKQLIDDWACVAWRSFATSWVVAVLGVILGATAAHWGRQRLLWCRFLPFWMQLPAAVVLGVLFVGGLIVVA